MKEPSGFEGLLQTVGVLIQVAIVSIFVGAVVIAITHLIQEGFQ